MEKKKTTTQHFVKRTKIDIKTWHSKFISTISNFSIMKKKNIIEMCIELIFWTGCAHCFQHFVQEYK